MHVVMPFATDGDKVCVVPRRVFRVAAGSSSVAECKLQVPELTLAPIPNDDARTYLGIDGILRYVPTAQVSPGNGVKLAGQNKGASTPKDEG